MKSPVEMRILSVEFTDRIRSFEIPAFRGAVSNKVGRSHPLFHNHEKDKLRYNYPLIQYKRKRGHPLLLCLDAGVEDVHHYFSKKDWSINLSGRTLEMKIGQLNLDTWTLSCLKEPKHYRIQSWIGLNQDNAQAFARIRGIRAQVEFLEKKLTGNLLSFAKGLDWHISERIHTEITHYEPPRKVSLKGNSMLGFTLEFACNLNLPPYIGLGKGVSVGYGVLHPVRKADSNG